MIDLTADDPLFGQYLPASARLPGAITLSANEERLRKAQAEKNALRKVYNAQRKIELQRALKRFAGDGQKLLSLVRFARKLGPTDGKKLIDAVKNAKWLIDGHSDLRYLALDLLGRAIVARRQAFGLVPFDDPLPAEFAALGAPTENAFSRIRSLLRIT